MMKKVLEVLNVDLNLYGNNTSILNITGFGLINTDGVEYGLLVPYTYRKPPEDGIYEFDLLAETGYKLNQQLTEVEVNYKWVNFPKDLVGIRIYGSSNHLVERIDQEETEIIFPYIDVDATELTKAISRSIPKSSLILTIKYAPKNAKFVLRSLKVNSKQLLHKSIKGRAGEISYRMGSYADVQELSVYFSTMAFTQVSKAKSIIVQNNPVAATTFKQLAEPLKGGKVWKATKKYLVK